MHVHVALLNAHYNKYPDNPTRGTGGFCKGTICMIVVPE